MSDTIKLSSEEIREQFDQLLNKTYLYHGRNKKEEVIPIQQLILNNTPNELFRYRKVNFNSIIALLSKESWGTIPNEFNDVFDSLPIVDIENVRSNILAFLERDKKETIFLFTTDNLDGISNIDENTKRNWEIIKSNYNNIEEINTAFDFFASRINNVYFTAEYCNQIFEQYRKAQIVSCFCENIDNLLMWGHYADGHKGFALEYDFSSINESCNCEREFCAYCNLKYHIFPVIYKSDRYNGDVMFSDIIFNKLFDNINYPIDTIDSLMFIKLFLYKTDLWNYENEWRLIFRNSTLDNKRDCMQNIKPKVIYAGYKISPSHLNILIFVAKKLKIPLKQEIISMIKGEPEIIFKDIALDVNINMNDIAVNIAGLEGYDNFKRTQAINELVHILEREYE